MFKRLGSLFRVLTRRREFEDGMSEELRFHIEQYTDDLVRSGMSREKAARTIRRAGLVVSRAGARRPASGVPDGSTVLMARRRRAKAP